MLRFRSIVLLALATLAGAPAADPSPADEVDFDRTILPILSDNCFFCHGPDVKQRKGDLRLDEEAAARKKNPDGIAAVVPGRSADSELIRRITSKDRDDVMPPPKSNKKLSKAQVDALRKWIDAGARWGEHWAFRPLAKPPVPAGPPNPIDAFIVDRLAREKLQPSPEADRATLLRRVSLDLTGLPPTPEETAAFLADRDPAAYEKVVDRLLASPRYGERMAWDWMEAARYADSNGYQGDGERTAWPWRDWVVQAFNENLPYDQFTVWQLAGDLLPQATRDQKLATGFCRNHPINGEGGRIAEENRVDYVMDMTETMGTIWLGLTLTCSRCHDHKFDPILKKEYYGLFAFFNQTPVNGGGGDPQTAPVLDLMTEEQRGAIARLDAEFNVGAARLRQVEGSLLPEELEDGSKVKELLKTAPEKRNRQQLDELLKACEKSAPDVAKAARSLRDVSDQRNSARKGVTRVMVMEDMSAPRKTYALDKGLYDKRQDEVSAGVPAKLPPSRPTRRATASAWPAGSSPPTIPCPRGSRSTGSGRCSSASG